MVAFAAQTTGYAVCDACQSMLVRTGIDVQSIGVSAALQEDGTPLQRLTSGSYRGVPFEIIGRIQVHYELGFWNEWFLMYSNGQHGWLGEAQGNYFASFLTQVPESIPNFHDLRRGSTIPLNGRMFTVVQKQASRVVGCEGELPFVETSGYEAPAIDLKTETILGATIDYSGEQPLVFIGETLEFEAFNFQNLREFESW